jgi:cob(I)alamin adenosyltransferase
MPPKIYTRKGDKGDTSVKSGRISKSSLTIDLIGEIDELSTIIGGCKLFSSFKKELLDIQSSLMTIMSYVSGYGTNGECKVEWMENEIDRLTKELPPLNNFIIPSSTECEYHLSLARVKTRKVERVWYMSNFSENKEISMFLNRLSDYFFTLIRYQIHTSNCEEIKWANHKFV